MPIPHFINPMGQEKQVSEGSIMFIGSIIMWSGSLEAVPKGWQLCDGTNGTPDLRDKFVVGAGDKYQTGDMGGSETVALTESQMPMHSHTATATTDSAGSHSHTFPKATGTSVTSNFYGIGSGSTNSVSTALSGEHSHLFSLSLTLDNTGESQPHNNLPPYYALFYIMQIDEV